MNWWNISAWDTNTLALFVLMTLGIAWVFPAIAFILFRYIVGKGQNRDPDEGISDKGQKPPDDNPALFPENDWVRNSKRVRNAR